MVTDDQPQSTRVRVEDPTPEQDPARTGCLWVGGILGVIVGVAVTFLAVPSILNFLFPSETIAVGDAFQDSKLVLRVASVEHLEIENDAETHAAYLVKLEVDARSSWSPRYDNFVLVLADQSEIRAQASGRPQPSASSPPTTRILQGASTLELLFVNGQARLAAPGSLHLAEPPVKFELPEPSLP